MISTQQKKHLLVLVGLFASSSYSHAEIRRYDHPEPGTDSTNANALQQRTLLGTVTKRSPKKNLRHSNRKLDGSGDWCPEQFPGSDTTCALTGNHFGTCYYSSNLPYHYNYDPHACSCNHDGTSTFHCYKIADFPVETEAPAPTAAPTEKPTSNNSNNDDSKDSWCPQHYPGDGASCALSGWYRGTCYWSSSAQEGEMPNREGKACSCNDDGTSRFSCRDYDFPGPVATAPPISAAPEFKCPTHFPGNDTECPLSGMWIGTCYWSSNHQEGELPNSNGQECSCNADGTSKFSCWPKP